MAEDPEGFAEGLLSLKRSLAVVYSQQGRYDDAKRLFEAAKR